MWPVKSLSLPLNKWNENQIFCQTPHNMHIHTKMSREQQQQNAIAVVEFCLSFSSYFEFWLVLCDRRFTDGNSWIYSSFLVAPFFLLLVMVSTLVFGFFSAHLFFSAKIISIISAVVLVVKTRKMNRNIWKFYVGWTATLSSFSTCLLQRALISTSSIFSELWLQNLLFCSIV